MSDVLLLYATAPDAPTAARIADALVEKGHAACVNILGPIQSVYRWRGSVERATETAFLVKTTRAAAADAAAAIRALHPHEVPAILAAPTERLGAIDPFADWVTSTITTFG